MGRVEGKEIDSETMGIAIREETGWERRMRKIRESTFMGPLVQTVETIAEVLQHHSIAAHSFAPPLDAICIVLGDRPIDWTCQSLSPPVSCHHTLLVDETDDQSL